MRTLTRRMPSATVLAVAACLAGLAGAGISTLPANGDVLALWLSSIAIAALGSGSVVWAHRTNFDLFQPLGPIAIYHILGFAVGGVYWWYASPPTYRDVSQAATAAAVLLDAIGFGLLAVGYVYSPFARTGRRLRSKMPVGPLPSEATPPAFFIVVLGVGWIARLQTLVSGSYFHFNPSGAIVGSSSWSAVIDSLAYLPTVLVAYLLARSYMRRQENGTRGRLSKTAVALLVVEFAWALPSGSRGALIGLILMMLLVRYYGLRRLPSLPALLVSVIVGVLLIFPLVLSYRSGSGTNFQAHVGNSLQSAVSRYAKQPWSERVADGLDATFTRFSEVPSVAAIIEGGPRASGLQAGETFSWTISGFIPRAIDPSKVDPGFFGNDFGRTYDFVAPRDRLAAVSVPQVGELFMNFGALGVLGMVVSGLLFRFFSDLTAARQQDPLALALYAVLAWPLINGLGNIFAAGFLGLVKLGVALSVVTVCATWLGAGQRRGFGRRSSARLSAR